MIVIRDNPVSEYYASVTLPEWQKAGFDTNIFDAHTPNNLPTEYKLNFTHLMTAKYVTNKLKKDHTPTEKACWYSHMSLWKKCIDLNRPILVLEHDCYPFYPSLIDIHTELDFVTYDDGALGCYIMSPRLAKMSWDKFVVNGDPVDIGPYGYIYSIISTNRGFQGTLLDSANFIPAACQVHDVKYGATIDHFGGTVAEPYKKELGTSYRIELVKGQKPDRLKIVKTIVG